MVQIVDDARNVEGQYAHQYENLARKVADLLPTGNGVLAEIGGVEGQLTVPLAKSWTGSLGAYSGTFSQLNKALSRAKLTSRVKVHKADYLDWLWEEFSDTYVGLMSSELLPEIDSYELSMLVSECYRVVTPGCLTVHSFLSPIARNRRQKLMIVADSNPRWTKTPPKEWFSPRPDQVVSALKQAEFRNIRVKRFKSNLIIRARAADVGPERCLAFRLVPRDARYDPFSLLYSIGGNLPPNAASQLEPTKRRSCQDRYIELQELPKRVLRSHRPTGS